MNATAYLRCLGAVVARDAVRFLHQRARLFAALVRPLLWLVVFAAGFRSILGVSIMLVTDYLLFGFVGVALWAVQMLWIPFWAAGVINGLGHCGVTATMKLPTRPGTSPGWVC